MKKPQLKVLRHITKRILQTAKHSLKTLSVRRAIIEVALLLIVLQLAVLGANSLDNRKPILGLKLEGHTISNLTNGNFQTRADAIIQEYENKKLTIKAADETSQVTLRKLGVKTDRDKVVANLMAEGRTGNIFTRLGDQNLALLGRRNISLGNHQFNSESAKSYLDALNKKVHIPPTDASFAYEKQKAIVRPDKHGQDIDIDTAIDILKGSNPYAAPTIELPIKQTTAQATSSMLEPLLPEVRAIAEKPLTITAGESQTTLSPQQLVEMIVPKITPDPKDANKTTTQITFDEAKLDAVVDEVVNKAVFAPKPTIISSGVVIQQGKSGVSTADDHPLSHVVATLLQRQTGVAMPDKAQVPLAKVDPPVVHQAVPRTRTGTGRVRLTFDDGPGAYTNQILDILARYNVRASFYVIGRTVPGYAGQMQRTVREGHTVCNHSYSHANLARLSRAGVHQELASTQTVIQQTTGVRSNCFRPPYGAYNQTVREVAASLGLSIDMWSVDPRDWARPGSGAIVSRVLNTTHSGAVVVLHVLNQQTVDALPAIIQGIRAQGYTLE